MESPISSNPFDKRMKRTESLGLEQRVTSVDSMAVGSISLCESGQKKLPNGKGKTTILSNSDAREKKKKKERKPQISLDVDYDDGESWYVK